MKYVYLCEVNMKSILYIFAIALMLLGGACTRHSENWATLSHADAVMEERPDSALALLQGIDSSTLNGDEEKARYALLLTLARYKNYIGLAEDSLVDEAELYYSRYPYSRERMLASFCKAYAEYDAQRFEAAIRHAVEAMDVSRRLQDTLWMARSYEVAAYIYEGVFSYRESADLMADAAEMYKAAGKRLNELYAKRDLALSLNSLKDYSQSVGIVDSLLLVAVRDFPQDTALRSDILSLAMRVYHYAGENDKALASWCGRKSISDLVPLSVANIINGSYIELSTGSPEAAKQLAGTIPVEGLSLKERINLIALDYSIASYMGDTRMALSRADSIFSFIDSEIIGIAENPVLGALSNFHREQSEVHRIRSESMHRRLVILLLVFGGIVVVTFISVYAVSRYRRLRMKAVVAELAWMTDLNSNLVTANKSLHHSISDLVSEKESLQRNIDDLASEKESLQRNIDDLASEKESLQRNIDDLASEKDRLKEDLDTFNHTLTSLRSEKESLSEENDRLNNKNNETEIQISALTSQRKLLKDTLNSLYLSHIRTLNSLSVQILTEDTAISPEIKGRLNMELKILRDRKKIMQLSDIVNSLNGGIIDNIKEQMPDIADIDLTLVVLTISGLSGKIISVITGLTLNTVYTKRRRAIERIERSNVKGWNEVFKGFSAKV